VSDVVGDIEDAADALGIASFAVTGGSGGGPHCLAVAALLPDRVLRCQASVSLAPSDAPDLDWLAGMTEGNVVEFNAARAGEAAMREVAERERSYALRQLSAGHADFTSDAYSLPESDVEQMGRHHAAVAAQLLFGLAKNADGWVDDNLAFARPWGFEVASIRVPVYLQYGRDDRLVPGAHGDWLAAHIPEAKVVVLDGGHMGDDALVESDMAWIAGHV
jgi:pimeloyl-ACP methyl ester carboxylesterase